MMEELLIGGKKRRLVKLFTEQISWTLPRLLHPLNRKPVHAHRKDDDRQQQRQSSSYGKDPRREVYNDPRRVSNQSNTTNDDDDRVKDKHLHHHKTFTLGFGPLRKKPVEYFDEDNHVHDDEAATHTNLSVDGFEQDEIKTGAGGSINECSTNISLPLEGEDGELENSENGDDVDYDGEESDGFGEEVTAENFFTSFERRRQPSQEKVVVEEVNKKKEEVVVVMEEKKKKTKESRQIKQKKIRRAPPRAEHEDEGWTRNDSSIFSPLSSALSSSSALSTSFQTELVSCSDISDDDERILTTSTDSGVAESYCDDYWSGKRKSKYHQYGPSREENSDDSRRPRLPSNDLRYRLNLIRSQPNRHVDVGDDDDNEEEMIERSKSSRSKKSKIDTSRKKKHRSRSRQRSHSHHRHKHRHNHH